MPPDHHTAYVALGSNLDDRLARIDEATVRLSTLAVAPVVRSHLYDTVPMYLEAQPRFLNGVAKLTTALEPEALLKELLAIETAMGRVRAERNGPRVIDLDLLLWDDLHFESPALVLPHPRLHERPFVLRPLMDLAPRLVLPHLGRAVADCWEQLESNMQPEDRPLRHPQ